MANTHVAHDCMVGDHVILANNAAQADALPLLRCGRNFGGKRWQGHGRRQQYHQ
jgi:hypothetical protein